MAKAHNRRNLKAAAAGVPKALERRQRGGEARGEDDLRGESKSRPWILAAAGGGAVVALVLAVAAALQLQAHGRQNSQAIQVVREAIEAVDADVSLREVLMELPSVETEPMRWANHVTTMNFGDFVNQSNGHVSMVSFFDPRSESFLVTRKDLDAAARTVQEDPVLRNEVNIGVVNAAVDSYLQARFSPETTSSWQENDASPRSKGELHVNSFRFGKSNYFPLVTKLFQNGEIVGEYDGTISAQEIAAYLRRFVAANATVLESQASADHFFAEDRYPLAVACFPENSEGLCAAERLAFTDLTQLQRGLMYYAEASNERVCQHVSSALAPCSIAVRSSASVEAVLSVQAEDAKPSYEAALYSFMLKHRDPALIELTPDNSWAVIENFHFIVVLLVDPNENDATARAIDIVERTTQRPEASAADRSLKYTHANGRNFASQFGIEMHELPRAILYASRIDDYLVYRDKEGKNLLVDESIDADAAAETLAVWISGRAPAPKHVTSTTSTDSAAESSTRSPPTVASANASTPAANTVGNVSETAAASESLSKAKVQGDAKASVPPAEATWKGLRLVDPALARRNLDTKELLDNIRAVYEDLLVIEESYRSFAPVRQALAENKVLRSVLDGVFSYLENRTHLQPILDAIPDTPAQLRELSADAATRQDLWVKVQRADAYVQRLRAAAQIASTQRNDELIAVLADDYTYLYNQRVRLIERRTNAMRERFVREQGRAPEARDQQVVSIERRSASELSLEEFVEKYAKQRRPVIITDLDMFEAPWTKDYIAEKCGHYRPKLVEKSATTHNWGGLVPVNEEITLEDFLSTHTQNETRKKWYLHDWGLPRHCPEILGPPPFENFRFPKYFAGDYFQRMPFVGYQHSWPSLFVGANGTESRMHIDSGGTNFWMYLIEGTKEWRFFDRFDTVELYGKPGRSHFYLDVFRPDFESMPLGLNAPMYQGVQHPGELIFIPGGCPHGVRNLDDIVGISMNYLDVSNEWLYLWMKLADHDFRDYELYANPAFPRGLRRDQEDLSFGAFKSQRWYAHSTDSLDLH